MCPLGWSVGASVPYALLGQGTCFSQLLCALWGSWHFQVTEGAWLEPWGCQLCLCCRFCLPTATRISLVWDRRLLPGAQGGFCSPHLVSRMLDAVEIHIAWSTEKEPPQQKCC